MKMKASEQDLPFSLFKSQKNAKLGQEGETYVKMGESSPKWGKRILITLLNFKLMLNTNKLALGSSCPKAQLNSDVNPQSSASCTQRWPGKDQFQIHLFGT